MDTSESSGDAVPPRRLSADSLARAFDNARRAFGGSRKRPISPANMPPVSVPPSLAPSPPTSAVDHPVKPEPPVVEPSAEPVSELSEPLATASSPADVIAAEVPEPAAFPEGIRPPAQATTEETELPLAARSPEPCDKIEESPAELDEATLRLLADDSLADEAPAAAAGEVTPQGLVEAMLFVGDPSGAPLGAERIAALLRGVNAAEVAELVERLNRHYTTAGCPYEIVTAAGGYSLVLRPEFDKLRERFYGRTRAARLSQAAIEVLAAVAYHEPLSAEEVSKLRGTPSGAILAQLVRRQLLRVERGTEKPRIARYSTTPRFLTLFGLESLADLPQSEEVNQR